MPPTELIPLDTITTNNLRKTMLGGYSEADVELLLFNLAENAKQANFLYESAIKETNELREKLRVEREQASQAVARQKQAENDAKNPIEAFARQQQQFINAVKQEAEQVKAQAAKECDQQRENTMRQCNQLLAKTRDDVAKMLTSARETKAELVAQSKQIQEQNTKTLQEAEKRARETRDQLRAQTELLHDQYLKVLHDTQQATSVLETLVQQQSDDATVPVKKKTVVNREAAPVKKEPRA